MRLRCALSLLLLVIAAAACTPQDDQEDQTDNSVKLKLLVDEDEIFGYVQDAEIGFAEFSDRDGIIGARIHCHIHLDDIARFQQAELVGALTVQNTNAVKDKDYQVDFTVDETDNDFEFYIPAILTVPVIVDFDLKLTYDDVDVENNPIHFEASLVYEFDVNKGQAAT
jgi:hypothetical protein